MRKKKNAPTASCTVRFGTEDGHDGQRRRRDWMTLTRSIKRSRSSATAQSAVRLQPPEEDMVRGNISDTEFWMPAQLTAHLDGIIVVEHGPVHAGWVPNRKALLIFRGRVFRNAPSSCIVSAGGSLFQLPVHHELGSSVHVTLTQGSP